MNRYTYLLKDLNLSPASHGNAGKLYLLLKLAESLDGSDNTTGNLYSAFLNQCRAAAGDCAAVLELAQLFQDRINAVDTGKLPGVS